MRRIATMGAEMASFEEVVNINEIIRLNNTLASRLQTILPHVERRRINRDPAPIATHFLQRSGHRVLWWATRPWDAKSPKGVTRCNNLFGYGRPGDSDTLTSDIEFSVHLVKFRRDLGGAFLQERPQKEVVLAHRGNVTYGTTLKREYFLDELDKIHAPLVSADGARFALIGRINSPRLANEIEDFVNNVLQAKVAYVQAHP